MTYNIAVVHLQMQWKDVQFSGDGFFVTKQKGPREILVIHAKNTGKAGRKFSKGVPIDRRVVLVRGRASLCAICR